MTETLWAHSLCKYRSLPELTSALPEAEPVGLLPTTPPSPEPTALARDQRQTNRYHVSSTHLPPICYETISTLFLISNLYQETMLFWCHITLLFLVDCCMEFCENI